MTTSTKTSRKKSVSLPQVLTYAAVIILLILFLFPIYWMLVSSFQPNNQLTRLPLNFLPVNGTVDNYVRIMTSPRFITYFKNSVIVSTSTTVICILVSSLAGYAFSRYRFRGMGTAMTAILSVQMFPIVAILIALFAFFTSLKLTNTRIALVLADLTFALPFSIWFLKSFFDTVPRDLEDAAAIDGCGRFRTLFTVVMPLVKPGILAVAIYTFLLAWDDFLFPLTLVNRDELRTLPVGMALAFIGEFEYDWAGMMTLSVVTSLPILIIFVFLQRYMVEGLTSGAVKG